MRFGTRAAVIAIVLGLGAVLASGCSTATDEATPPTAPTTARTSATPATPAVAPPLRVRLQLPSSVLEVGSSMRGEVIVQNDAVESTWILTCMNFFAAYLQNETYRQEILWPTCGEWLEIPGGESRWPIEVVTSGRSGCIATASDSELESVCPPAGSPGTATPAGLYQVSVLNLTRPELPTPAPLTIEVRELAP